MSEKPVRTILDAIREVLQRHAGPMTPLEITSAILVANLYPFGWKSPNADPETQVRRMIHRYCEGTNDPYPKHLRKIGDRYDLIERRPAGEPAEGTLSPTKPIFTASQQDVVAPGTPVASDLGEPAHRQLYAVYRIIRDTALARRVKALHQNECQICGHTIVLPGGSHYSEGHHIRPLGEPHNGPDVVGNIICVCPNHHAELDYGVRTLSLAELRAIQGHAIGEEYIRYHNDVIHRPGT